MELCRDLLHQWCEQLLKLQITELSDPALFGGILCPACGRVHGRCFDAIYPFLYLADTDKEMRYLDGAIRLFDWAEHTISQPDGSFFNDSNSEWKGTTVFSVIQLVKALSLHGHVLPSEVAEKWKKRIWKAALFLRDYKEFEVCNINYRITNALALELCSRLFHEQSFSQRGHKLIYSAIDQISESGILFGEGRPIDGFSQRGCRPVDIGYNIEESLPALTEYAVMTKDEFLFSTAWKALDRHLFFFLEDGAIDNSFGTRNYKWSYWGSRTSDGCGAAYLLAARKRSSQSECSVNTKAFALAATRNIELLAACSHDGLLYGGPHLYEKGEYPCVHHTFCHAKILAEILDEKLESLLIDDKDARLPRAALQSPGYVSETDTWIIPGADYTATVTAYDWVYGNMKGGHASGGSLSLLHHHKGGPILCGSMSRYQMKEANNMQLPRFERHECLTPRLEYEVFEGQTLEESNIYSNLYDVNCIMNCRKNADNTEITIQGCLKDLQGRLPFSDQKLNYEIVYRFSQNKIAIVISCPQEAKLVLPLISQAAEAVELNSSCLTIKKDTLCVEVTVLKGQIFLPYGNDRVYNLVPGLTALRTDMKPDNGVISFEILFR